jgi:hypothetical protein
MRDDDGDGGHEDARALRPADVPRRPPSVRRPRVQAVAQTVSLKLILWSVAIAMIVYGIVLAARGEFS